MTDINWRPYEDVIKTIQSDDSEDTRSAVNWIRSPASKGLYKFGYLSGMLDSRLSGRPVRRVDAFWSLRGWARDVVVITTAAVLTYVVMSVAFGPVF